MNLNVQYELFEENDELSILKKEMVEMRIRNNNVQKGLFARHNDLAKLYMKQQDEIERLKIKIHELTK